MSVRDFDLFESRLAGRQLVEASAGTGKTWNLSGLMLRLLLEKPLPVDGILVVTFTNAAVAELRERIRARIALTLAGLRGQPAALGDVFVATLLRHLRAQGLQDPPLQARLELALQSFDEAPILTIHGFCQRALAELPFSAGMPLQQTLLADDTELQQQVVHDFWRRRIAGDALPPTLIAHLIDHKDTPQRLQALLQRRLDKPLARLYWPDPSPPAVDPQARDSAFAEARALWDRERIAAVVQQALPQLHGGVYKPDSVAQALDAWQQLCALPQAPLSLSAFPKLDLLGGARLQPKKGQTLPQWHAFFDAAQRLLDADAALPLQRLALLRELLDQGPQALREAKRAQRVQGFDDLLLNLHQRLAAPGGAALAAKLRARFPAALIDEFQDTDPLQYAIFDAIYRGSDAPLFLVGDPKQAIYSFRSADLYTYLQARQEAGDPRTLTENQRSSAGLLRALNGLFGAQPRAFMLPGLDYHPVHCGEKPRLPLLEDAQPPRAALQLWQLPLDETGEPLLKAEAMQRALAATAAEIARLLGEARAGRLRLGERPLAPGDIAVLVRSHAHGAAMRVALTRAGVGSVALSQASVFHSSDAAELERLLAAMLEPQREPLLRAALATEAMGRDAAAIDALAQDEAALLALIARFAGYRGRWLQRGVGRMLREWLRHEDVAARLLARADGERRLTNLLHLFELLEEASLQHPAPEALLRWLQAQRADARGSDAAQLRLESDRHLVQVVTVHKSKGLEYPMVFCPLLWDGAPERGPGGDGIEYHDTDGTAVIDFRLLEKKAADALKARAALERASETMRLIYVALTRAVHRCTLVVGPYLTLTPKGTSTAQSGRARLNWLVASAGLEPADWLKSDIEPATTIAAWQAFAARHAPDAMLTPLPEGPGAVLSALPVAAEQLAALPPPAVLPRGWRIGSYSSLAHGAQHEGAAVDHDLRALDATEAPGASPDEDDILNFPRGAAAGECLHAVFESIAFDDPQGWPQAAAQALRRHTAALPSDATTPLRLRMLLNMLHDVTQTPLQPGLRLADVPVARRLVELEFHLPARRLDAAALQALLRRLSLPVPALGFGALQGYLRGFIDLVFEHGGRYWVLDWKSNHLGNRPTDYAAPALEAAMAQQGYHLQALLYALALHRHLQQRLTDYDHDAHFGGVLYLFVRGVRPGWRQPDGSAAGVHVQRPSLQALQQLEALLDGSDA